MVNATIQAIDNSISGEIPAEQKVLGEFLKVCVTEENAEIIKAHIDRKGGLADIFNKITDAARKLAGNNRCVMMTDRQVAEVIAKEWKVPIGPVAAEKPAEEVTKKPRFAKISLDD